MYRLSEFLYAEEDLSPLHIGVPVMVDQFELSDAPKQIACFPNEEIGINSIKVLDSLLIIGHKTYWSIYDKTSKQHIGNFLSVGDGPDQFIYLRPCSNAYFGLITDSICALIPDIANHRILKLNLQKCKDGNKDYLTPYIHNDEIDNSSWDVIVSGPDSYLVSQPHADMRGFNRIIFRSGEKGTFECASALDTVKVKDDGHINLLSRVTRYDPTADKFVEAMGYLNQINIISGDGTNGKTICVGDKLDDLSEKEDSYKGPNRKENYVTVSAWPYGFGAVYSGATDLQRMMGKEIQSEFQFFDWDGQPKYRFRIPGYILAFDLDFDEKILYVVDEQEDVLKTYDASPIVDCLMQPN